MNWNRFQGTLSGAGAPYPRNFTPAGLAGCPLCLPTAHGPWGAASTLGLRLDNRISPDMRIIASRPATACLCADGCSPYTSLLQSGVMACSFPHGFPLGRISDVPSGPIQLPDCRQPAQARRKGRRACADWRRCRKSPFLREVFRAAGWAASRAPIKSFHLSPFLRGFRRVFSKKFF